MWEDIYPIQCFFGLTYACNLMCPHCYSRNKRGQGELPFKEIIEIIDQLYSLGIFKIVLSHGENTLRRDFQDIIEYMSKKGFHVTVITNGTTIDQEKIEQLKKAGISKLIVSLDSPSPEEHDKFRGVKGTWTKAITALRLAKKHHIKTTINMALNPYNQEYIEQMISLAKREQIDEINFLLVRPQGLSDDEKRLMFKPETYKELIKRIWHLKVTSTKKDPEILIHDPLAIAILGEEGYELDSVLTGLNACGAASMFISITPNGEVLPCNFLPEVLGNLRKTRLKNIIESKKFKKIGKSIPNECKKCKYVHYCRGGCKAFSHNKGDLFSRDPRCPGVIYENKGRSKK